MMLASRMMCALRHIGANIASLRNEVEQHHFERSEKHHIAAGDASFSLNISLYGVIGRETVAMFTELSYNGAKKGGLNMKKICFILSLILILCCCSCTINFNKPDTVTIEEREYKKAFIGELYPIDDVVSSEDINISGNSYYKCFKTQYRSLFEV